MYRKSIDFFNRGWSEWGIEEKEKLVAKICGNWMRKWSGGEPKIFIILRAHFLPSFWWGALVGHSVVPIRLFRLKFHAYSHFFQFVFVRRKKRHIDQMNLGEARASAR